ncbi:MAG: cell division ATP-binding protein FtsE [Nitrospirota bacterium]
MITFREVFKHYDNQIALRNITFSVEKGEMVFLTGPSGSGKTTLLRLIYLAEKADEGTIYVAEWNLNHLKEADIPAVRRNIGIIFQDFRLLDNKNVFENVALALRIRGENDRDIKQRVYDSLKTVNLRHKTDGYPRALSGGEQQRVAIARAIVAEPVIILADEPTGNVDPDTAAGIMRTFKEINARGATVIVATHNRELFRNTGRKVLRLDNGNLAGEEIA